MKIKQLLAPKNPIAVFAFVAKQLRRMASLDLQLIPCKMDQSYVSHSYVDYGPYPVVATGRPRYTPDRNGVLHQEHKNLIFIALHYSNNFNFPIRDCDFPCPG